MLFWPLDVVSSRPFWLNSFQNKVSSVIVTPFISLQFLSVVFLVDTCVGVNKV